MRFLKLAWLALFLIAACPGDDGAVPSDGGAAFTLPDAAPDATVVADATVPDATPDATPDAAPPDAAVPMCPRHTKGVLVGDSIVSNLYNNARNILLASGHTVFRNAVAGATVHDQLLTWQASALRGDPTIDWFYVQCGINDVAHGGVAALAIADDMEVLLDDIHTHNPGAVVFVGIMDPARTKLEAIAADRYPLWQALNALYVSRFAARGEISNALNNGADALLAIDDNGDGLHPSPTGDRTSAMILAGWVTPMFQAPCAP
jgi:lysophospholipase L1-like esterase